MKKLLLCLCITMSVFVCACSSSEPKSSTPNITWTPTDTPSPIPEPEDSIVPEPEITSEDEEPAPTLFDTVEVTEKTVFTFDNVTSDGREMDADEISVLSEVLGKTDMNPYSAQIILDVEILQSNGLNQSYNVNNELHVNDNITKTTMRNNVFGNPMVLDQYNVTNEDGSVLTYMTYDMGETWIQAHDTVNNIPALVDVSEFASNFTGSIVRRYSDGFCIEGMCRLTVDNGYLVDVKCECLFNKHGEFDNAVLYMEKPVTLEKDNNTININKFEIALAQSCEPLVVPEDALSAPSLNSQDYSEFLETLTEGYNPTEPAGDVVSEDE